MPLENITDDKHGPSRRRYEDGCGTAHALDLIGERWALLVMRELMLGPKRFSDIRADLPGISANVLTQRLEGLERDGIVMRRRLDPPASGQVYELSEWGYQSLPIMGDRLRSELRCLRGLTTSNWLVESLGVPVRSPYRTRKSRVEIALGGGG